MKLDRPSKHPRLLDLIRNKVMTDRFIATVHAKDRQFQRCITLQQIKYVLCNGYHEKSKDKYDEVYSAWNYAIRGRTFDDVDIRVIVSFDEEDDMLIITVFEVGRKEQ